MTDVSLRLLPRSGSGNLKGYYAAVELAEAGLVEAMDQLPAGLGTPELDDHYINVLDALSALRAYTVELGLMHGAVQWR